VKPVEIEWSVIVPGDVESVWAMIVEARHAVHWWGRLDQDLTHVAQELTIATGSTSFYRLWVDAFAPGRAAAFTSAYLGVSPITRVRFELTQTVAGVAVQVVECLEGANPATIHQARQLWQHRLNRLVTATHGRPSGGTVILAQGTDDITASRTLGSSASRPLHAAVLAKWLPLGGAGESRWFFVVDGHGPRPFPITHWWLHYDDLITIGIQVAPNHPDTEAQISVAAHDDAVDLVVRHGGWATVAIDEESREVLRDRFAATWQHALYRATLIGRG
jgi:uncharacterized protein YndB with AHSA1/START domain